MSWKPRGESVSRRERETASAGVVKYTGDSTLGLNKVEMMGPLNERCLGEPQHLGLDGMESEERRQGAYITLKEFREEKRFKRWPERNLR